MKRGLLFLFLISSFVVGAQQRPHFTQYILNNYVVNPAISGIENYADLKLSARDQWVGLNGAPQTFYLTVHAPLGKMDYKATATSFAVPGENPRGTAYWENYTASAPHHGLGFSMISDRTGNFTRTTVSVSYAYHVGVSPTTNIALGVSPSISRIGRNLGRTDFGGGVSVDPAQTNNSANNRFRPDLSAGIWIYSPRYFIGASAQQLIPQNLSFTGDAAYTQGRLIPHLFLTAGYRFLLSEQINALPSVMVKLVGPNRPQVDINLKLQYLDFLWMGGGIRVGEGYQAMMGLNLANSVNLGYAYDFTRTRLNTVSRGTHELIVGFLLGNRYDDACPRAMW